MGNKLFSRDWKDAKNNHGLPILDMPEFLRFLRKTITENRPFTGGGSLSGSKRGEEIGPIGDWDQNSASSSKKSSCPLSIPKKVIPDGPIRFGSLGDGDAFIHKLLEEKHIETKEQLYKISLRPTSFDAKEELRARPQDDQSPQPQQQLGSEENMHVMTSKKVQRMHFIGSYNFLKSDDFEEEETRAYYDTNNM